MRHKVCPFFINLLHYRLNFEFPTKRFLYGQEKKFSSFELAMEVYKLAHEMQITSLLHVVDQELLNTVDKYKALQVYDLFVRLENQQGLQICKKVGYCFAMKFPLR